MRILVVGGAGYIGSHVVSDLKMTNLNVDVYDNLSSGNLKNIPSEVNFYKGDLLDYQLLSNVLSQGYDCVMHFAALKAAGESMERPNIYANNNLIGSINLLNAMIENKVFKMIFSSSAAVYGKPKYLPIDEKHSTLPTNFYGYTKLNIEQLIDWYSKLYNLKYVSLRYFNATGYGLKNKHIEYKPENLFPIIMEVITGKRNRLKIFGDDYNTFDGTCIRDYIHVSDLSLAHVKAINYLSENNSSITLNLGTGSGLSVKEVVSFTESIIAKKINKIYVNRRKGDVPELYANSSLANEKLSWKAKYSSIDNIINSMLKVYEV